MIESSEFLPSLEYPVTDTRRPISEGAEKWLGEPIKCLDHGFVYLRDYMGNEFSVEEAARVSYGLGTRKVSEAVGLIRYLRRHLHTTPFEMVDLKFHARMPIFVARQWVRHRTASINEYSARYSVVKEEFYIPDPSVLAEQSKANRQGRGQLIALEQADVIRAKIKEEAEEQYDLYEWLLNDDGTGKKVVEDRQMVAREIARGPLGTNFYTEWYWKVNLHNFMHFAGLRMDAHAQYEIRVYADAMARIIKDAYPIAWKAFEDYELNAVKLTDPEVQVIKTIIAERRIKFTMEEITAAAAATGLKNRRETEEMVTKLNDLGLLSG